MRKLQITLWTICLCLALFIGGRFLQAKQRKPPTTPLPGGQPAPSPKLSPDQVVGIVLKALQANDKKDSGIATTFRFASPANTRVTGPLSHFIPMVKSPAYRPMLNFKRVVRGKIQRSGDQARE